MTLDDPLRSTVEEKLSRVFHSSIKVTAFQPVGGGCINNGGLLKTTTGNFFMKYNNDCFEGMFHTEARGLELLNSARAIHIPQVAAEGKTPGNQIYIVMEWIESGKQNKQFWEHFGHSLAELHKVTNNRYGLDFNNYIGSLPQYNDRKDHWTDFFIYERLERQIDMDQNHSGELPDPVVNKIRSLYPRLQDLLPPEPPSLLHGDLWSGNFLINSKGEAALIDPAVYYGSREIELAFTRLFGGFSPTFYDAYQENYPLEPGFDERKDIYNLYPLLVHVNLFGGAYLGQIQNILAKY